MTVIRDEELPAAQVLEEEGYAAWVRALNGPPTEPTTVPPLTGVKTSPDGGRFVRA